MITREHGGITREHAAVDELRHLIEVRLIKATRRQRRRADTDASRDEGTLVARDRVLVDRDRDHLQNTLDARAINAIRPQVNQHQMVLGAAGDEAVAAVGHRGGERL